MIKKTVLLFFCFMLFMTFADDVESLHSKRIATFKYGIEPQLIELISTLKLEKNTTYVSELITLFDTATSQKLKSAIFDYFIEFKLPDLESRALSIIQKRDSMQDSLLSSAFSYLIELKSKIALNDTQNIINYNEKKYLNAAIKLIAVSGSNDDVAALSKLYNTDDVDQITKENIILALGKLKAESAFELLAKLVKDTETVKTLRMYACTALGDMADGRAVDVLIFATQDSDPNVRAYAVSALANYLTESAMLAIREALRDGHVLVRIAAAKAIVKNKDTGAIPFLEYKASFDPEKAVRDAAIASLSELGGDEVSAFLFSLYEDQKTGLAHRANSFAAIIKTASDSYIVKATEIFAKAQLDNDRAFFMGLAKAVTGLETDKALPFIKLLLGDKEYSIRLGGIAWAERNKSKALIPELTLISTNDQSESVRKRAKLALDKLSN